MKYCSWFFLVFITACSAPSHEGSFTIEESAELTAQLSYALDQQLLNVWYPKSVDILHGGFLTDFTHDWQSEGKHDKMIVTQARHLWTVSKAAEFFPKNSAYPSMGDHGYSFLKSAMWDSVHGGFYTIVNQQGELIKDRPEFDEKWAYGNAFAIYGLAAYYKMSGNEEALELAKETFHWLEKHSHDAEYKGYYPFLSREGDVLGILNPNEVSAQNEARKYKDQNPTIHLLEAFAELYQVWPNDLLKERLKEQLLIVRDEITYSKGYMGLYFQRDWTPVSYRDSSSEARDAHYRYDHVSFGHDIETAFLMLEAAEVIGESHDNRTLSVATIMVNHTLENGFDKTLGGIYERGYYFAENAPISIIDDRKNWWAQAEGMHSMLLFSTLYPEEPIYKEAFLKQWKYIQNYVIDQQNGGWYSHGVDGHQEYKTAAKGQIWKGNYHNGRALMHCIRLLSPDHEGSN